MTAGPTAGAQPVAVVAPTPPSPPGWWREDLFGRTVSGAWGSADLGGAWTGAVGGRRAIRCAGGVGRIVLATAGVDAGGDPGELGISVSDVDETVDLSLDKAPTGSGESVALVARKVGTTEYRLKLRPAPDHPDPPALARGERRGDRGRLHGGGGVPGGS